MCYKKVGVTTFPITDALFIWMTYKLLLKNCARDSSKKHYGTLGKVPTGNGIPEDVIIYSWSLKPSSV